MAARAARRRQRRDGNDRAHETLVAPPVAPLPPTPVVPREAAPEPQQRSSTIGRWLLYALCGVALVVHLWGIRRDLPYIMEDPQFMGPAVYIAGSGDLNPRDFGYPGSTTIYPLAAVVHVWYAATHGGSLLHANTGLKPHYDTEPANYYLLGRLLTVVYAVGGVLLVYLIGRPIFGETAALVGALLALFHPTEIFFKEVRNDSATLFFSMLGLWCCLRLYNRPTLRNHVLAGGAIGLAIATKYYLGALVGVLALVDGLILWRRRHERTALYRSVLHAATGLVAVALAFALTTPYFFLDRAAVAKTLGIQLRTTHPNADGLSPIGNLLWYLREALPETLSWPQLFAAVGGIALLAWKRNTPQLLLLAYATMFLIGISPHALHWQRWLIPILPVFALSAAHAVALASEYVGTRWNLSRRTQQALLATAVAVVIARPGYEVLRFDWQFSQPSTHVLAREWVNHNLPPNAGVAYEWLTLPPPLKHDPPRRGNWVNRDLGRNSLELLMQLLGNRGTLEYYSRGGFRYLVTSGEWFNYYPANADRYPEHAAFYSALLSRGQLLYRVEPTPTRAGTEIRVYEID